METTTNNVIENNRLIAEFMGAEKYEPNDYDLFSTSSLVSVFEDIAADNPDAQHFYHPKEMKFHTSFDWLIPVVEKIENIEIPKLVLEGDVYHNANFLVNIAGMFSSIDLLGDMCFFEDFIYSKGAYKTKISPVYEAVVEFIKWYNENK